METTSARGHRAARVEAVEAWLEATKDEGDKVIIPPTVSNADASQKFPQGFDEILPYLRYVDVSK